MKRSDIDNYIEEAIVFWEKHQFYLPQWAKLSPKQWQKNGKEYDEIRYNSLGWDVTDFAKNDFENEGLTLFTIRNGNVKRDKKTYCEKIMLVREKQVTPIHFHWKKMEDIINRGGGTLCMKLWKADKDENLSGEECTFQLDGVTTKLDAGKVLRLEPGQSISFEPYMYHTFWAENGHCMVGEVSTVNDDDNDNRFYEPLGRYPSIEEDTPAKYVLCNEY